MRGLVFLGIFSLLLVVMLAVTAVLVQMGVVKTLAHGNLGWAAMVPLVLYVVLSLRHILQAKRV